MIAGSSTTLGDVILARWVDLLGFIFLHSLWVFGLLAVIAFVVLAAMRQASSNARYYMALFVLALMATSPLVIGLVLSHSASTFVVNGGPDQHTTVSSGGAEYQSQSAINRSATDDDAQEILPAANATDVSAQIPVAKDRIEPVGSDNKISIATLLRPWMPVIVVFWMSGALLFSFRPIIGWLCIQRLRKTGTSPVSGNVEQLSETLAANMAVRQSFRIVQSVHVAGPIVVGWIRPLILLPLNMITGLSESQLQAVIAHELSHIKRHDYLVNILQTAVETAFFYHPGIWWLSGKIRAERELCCDDMAVAAVQSPYSYGRALLAVADLNKSEGLLAMGITDGPLLHRVKRLFGADPVPRSPLATVLSVLMPLILVAGSVAALNWLRPFRSPDHVNTAAAAEAESVLMSEDEMQAWRQIFASPAHLNGSGFHNRSLYQHAQFLQKSNYPDTKYIEQLYRDAQKPITDISLFDAPDSVWPLLPRLRSAEILDLTATQLSAISWKAIAQMTSLRKIHFVNNTGVLPSDLVHVRQLTNLEHLDIMFDGYSLSDDRITKEVEQMNLEEQKQREAWAASGKRSRSNRIIEMAILTDRALPALSELRKLRSLTLVNTHCTGRGLESLQHLEQVEHFDVAVVADSQKAAFVLGSWHQLKSIQGVSLSDVMIAEWNNLTHLEKLDGWAGDVTLASIETLAGFTDLKRLGLRGCQLTYGDINRLLELRQEHKQQLEYLDLSHCRWLSRSDADSLQKKWDDIQFRFTANLPEEVERPTSQYSGHIRTPEGNTLPENTIVRYRVKHHQGLHSSNGFGGNIPVKGHRYENVSPIGELWLCAYADGYAPAWTGPHLLKPGGLLNGVDIALSKGRAVTIKIVDQFDQPIPDAKIRALPEINGSFEGFAAKYSVDAGGHYLFPHLADTRYQASIEAEGVASLTTDPFSPQDGAKITLQMRRSN